MSDEPKNLLEVEHLKQYFPGGIRAVDDVSLQIHQGETLGLRRVV